jgi:hypothetical protein
MGQAKIKQYNRRQFLREHADCCYCGAKAETTDHCPPRAFFINRRWPEGYEFPACSSCNDAARKTEQVIACCFRFKITDGEISDELKRLIIGVRNNHSEVFHDWSSPGSAKRRRLLKEGFGELGSQLWRDGLGASEIGSTQMSLLLQFGAKLGQALYYKHNSKILRGRVIVHLISFINNYDFLDAALRMAPIQSLTQRCNVDLGPQFSYRCNHTPDPGVLYAVVRLGEQQGYQLFAFTEAAWSGLCDFNPEITNWIEVPTAPARTFLTK